MWYVCDVCTCVCVVWGDCVYVVHVCVLMYVWFVCLYMCGVCLVCVGVVCMWYVCGVCIHVVCSVFSVCSHGYSGQVGSWARLEPDLLSLLHLLEGLAG